jgi:hypothetical protein
MTSARSSSSAVSSRSRGETASPPLRERGRAFGLEVRTGFEVPGLAHPAPAGLRRTALELAPPGALDSAWGRGAGERIAELRHDDGRPAVTIDSGGARGYLVFAEGFGRALIARDGRGVLCEPLPLPAWRWQRYLTGQVLPFAAVLQGLEVFHASAVVAEGRALAIVAHSGTGKTSLALNLALAGLPFLADDVVALERAPDGLIAHPGAGLANVRPGEAALEQRIEAAGLGAAIGRGDGELRLRLERHTEPVPLGALVFLERRGEDPLRIERLRPVDPRLLLAATFNLSLRTPDRLARQLDVAARVERSAPVYRVRCPRGVGAAELAGRLRPLAEAA